MTHFSSRILSNLTKNRIFLKNKCLSSTFVAPTNLLTNARDPLIESKRHKRKLVFRSWPIDDLPVEWQRPPPKDCKFDTGDHVRNMGEVDLSMPKPFFDNCTELKDADEYVKKVFTLATADYRQITYQKMRETVKKFQRHKYDISSFDVKVAVLTLKIRGLQELFSSVDHEIVRWKRALVELVSKRYKYLNVIRQFDRERFNYLVQELGIDWTPPCEDYLPQQYTRKKAIKALILEHCDGIKQRKMDAFKKQLEAQKLDFQREKEETEKWIAQEEKILAEYETRFKNVEI